MHTLKQSQLQCIPQKKHELLNLNHPSEQRGSVCAGPTSLGSPHQVAHSKPGRNPKSHSKPRQSPEDMLCFAMLCYVLVCYALLCYAKLCYAMPPFAMLSQARSGIFRHPQASARSSKLCNANHCKTMYKKTPNWGRAGLILFPGQLYFIFVRLFALREP